MAKKVSEHTRIIRYAFDATREELNAAIESLVAIRDKRFPTEKKARKPRAKPEPKEPEKPPLRAAANL